MLHQLTAAESDGKAAQLAADAAFDHAGNVAPWVTRTLEGLAGLAQADRVAVGV